MEVSNTMKKSCLALCLMLSMVAFSSHIASAQKAQLIDRNGEVLTGTLQEEGRSVIEQDSLALVALYHSTNGENWDNNSGWLVEMVEFWHGVDEVTEIETASGEFEWRVTEVDLRSNFLLGELPPEIGLLDQVTNFNVRQNFLIGNIPREVEGMTQVRDLSVQNHPLMTGVLPWEELVSLPNLTHLRGSFNNFYGVIPEIAGDFPALQQFVFQGNPFSGPFPEQFSEVSTLTRIYLAETFFTGPWPQTYGALEELYLLKVMFSPFLDPGGYPDWVCEHQKLGSLRFNGANRRGEIPACFANMPSLEHLWVGGPSDELTGTIPDLTFAESLSMLFIWNSDITGPIPDYLGEMPSLSTLYLKGINVTGAIPASLANATSLSQLYLKNLPNVVGPMPDLRNLNLTRFRIDNLGFDIGPFPDWIAEQTGMAQMRLMNSGITGSVPESWSALTNLQWLKLEGNPGITGELPSWVTEGNQMLKEIRLGGTSVDLGADGQIPTWLCDMPQLEQIRLNDLGLTGSIPACIGDLILLGSHGDVGRFGWIPHAIDFSNNELTGEIPASLGNLTFVNGIDLSNNQLSGQIPAEFFNIGRIDDAVVLEVLDVSGNAGLTGEISMELTNYNPNILRILHFDGTDLCEPVDAGFGDWIQEMQEVESFPITFRGIGGRSIKRAATKCDGTTNVEPEMHAYSFRLNQNYPNPFNPSTTISYAVPSEAHVELIVYNVIGQRVATLVSETVTAGQHEVNFDASNLSSGTYIYRLVAGDQNLTQSMMLLK